MEKNTPLADRLYSPSRRKTLPVQVGGVIIGGEAPVLVQSMTTTNAKDVEATVKQTLELARAGCQLVRITAPTASAAAALCDVVTAVRAAGSDVAISADIHFQREAAYEAVKWVDKVRVNPGNFAEIKNSSIQSWEGERWSDAVAEVRRAFGTLIEMAKERRVAIRIGTNHGSLSPRMVWKYGDTVEGMVESALEYLRVCEEHQFDQILFSMKASNPKVVIQAYRLLAERLDRDHRPYPLHVGVTEAGEGEDGRLKSAVGIGALLLDGLGDTLRVSLTEPPVEEIPVAKELVRVADPVAAGEPAYREMEEGDPLPPDPLPSFELFSYNRRKTADILIGALSAGGDHPVRVGIEQSMVGQKGGERAEWVSGVDLVSVDVEQFAELNAKEAGTVEVRIADRDELLEALVLATGWPVPLLWSWVGGGNEVAEYRWMAGHLAMAKRDDLIVLRLRTMDDEAGRMYAASRLGSLLCDGIGDLICLDVEGKAEASIRLGFDILQVSGRRRTRAEFISCPGCGRTLFDLVAVTEKIKKRTNHLDDLSIAVMGCIVNGPGEMADADFGYVGGAPGKINLYVKKECVQAGIPEAEAVEALVQLIKSSGRWKEPGEVAQKQ